MSRRTARLFACGLALLWAAHAAAAEPLSVAVRRISPELALRAAQAVLASCRQQGLQVGVTVVDRDGQVQLALRDMLASPLTLQVSRLKAATAAAFNAPTSQLQRQGSSGLAQVPGLLFQAGAVPIDAGGERYGAIGVSGAPLGESDESCARSGAAAIVSELELQ